jgi:hypothetical protein
MNMKFVTMTIAAMLFTLSTAHASDASYSAQVGVETIVRTVINKNLVDHEAKKLLIAALESPGAQGIKLGKMLCDRQLSKDVCVIPVTTADDKSTPIGEESAYQLEISIFQGTVTFANLALIAG